MDFYFGLVCTSLLTLINAHSLWQPNVTPTPTAYPANPQLDNCGVLSLSSQYVNSLNEDFTASKCMDENLNTMCVTKKERYPYLVMEYPNEVLVKKVKVVARADKWAKRVKQLVVSVTNVKPTRGQLVSGGKTLGTFAGPAISSQEIMFKSETGLRGKYVVIQQGYKGLINYVEIEISKERLATDLMHAVSARHGPIRFDARRTGTAWNKRTDLRRRKKKIRTPQKQKTNEDLNKHVPQARKEGEPFVLQRAWCLWLGRANAKYYRPCCKLWQPYVSGLSCSQKQKRCYNGWASVGSECYRIVNAATFEQARAFCEYDWGSLVEITSQIEQDILSKFYNDSLINGWVWLGAQKTQEDKWRWISSGEKIIFNAWGSGEPNNTNKEENCLIWDGNKLWKAVRCDYTYTNFKAICEQHKELLPPPIDDLESVTVRPSIKPPKPCYCGIPNRNLRIVRGKKAEKHEYPWQVALVYGNGNTPFCSGSLISRETVLTAAHCTERYEAKDISVVIGEHDVTDNSDEQRNIRVKQIIQNSLYNFKTIDYDFSLVILMNPVKWSKKAKPICLPNQSTNYENVRGIVSGWGALEYNGLNSDTLLETEVMTMTNKECTTNKQYNPSEITSSMICAAGYGKDACQGDSGGPLISQETGGYYSVIGVVSWGKGCADQDSPGVYSRVAHQMPWITDNIVGQTCLIPQPTSSNLGTFHSCVGSWCRQSGTSGQFTRCESVRDGGLTCVNPEIRYGSTEGGIPGAVGQHRDNDYDAWCQQVLGFGSNSKATYGARDCSAPRGKLFWSSSYDESGYKWCDSFDGYWKDATLDAHSRCDTEGITSLTCHSLRVASSIRVATGQLLSYLSSNQSGHVYLKEHLDDHSGRQKWIFKHLIEDVYNILVSGGTDDGEKFLSCRADGFVDLWSNGGGDRQKWRIQPVEEDTYNIKVLGGTDSGKEFLSCTEEGLVDLYGHAGERQRWKLTLGQ